MDWSFLEISSDETCEPFYAFYLKRAELITSWSTRMVFPLGWKPDMRNHQGLAIRKSLWLILTRAVVKELSTVKPHAVRS